MVDQVTRNPEVPAGSTRTADASPPDDVAEWQRPAPTAAERRADAVVGVILFLDALLVMALTRVAQVLPEPAPPVVSVLLLAAITVPLGLRRRFPAMTLLVVSVAFVLAGELQVPETVVTNIALFLALYSVGAWEGDRRRAAVVRGVVVAGMFVWLLLSFFRVALDPPDGESVVLGPGALSPLAATMLVQLIINILYFAGAVWFGNHAWRAARDRALLERRAHELEAERVLVEAQAVTIERMRLARELHDAVAHHVSLIGVQAAAARTLLAADPDRAAQMLEQVEDSARGTIRELQGLLGTLRAAPDEQQGAVGSLGVERIPELVASAGPLAHYRVVGEPVPLRPLASLNLYRIAQESLTNVRKHAGSGARVDVRLRYLEDAVELEVADDGAGRRRRSGARHGGGLGIVGMRERVASDGGELHTGPRREGGFLVRARIPLRPTPGTPPQPPSRREPDPSPDPHSPSRRELSSSPRQTDES